MTGTIEEFEEKTSVELDEYGFAEIQVKARGLGVVLAIQEVDVSVTSNDREPQANFFVYNGREFSHVKGTSTGSHDSDPDFSMLLNEGKTLIVQWKNGDPGATASLTVYGEKHLP